MVIKLPLVSFVAGLAVAFVKLQSGCDETDIEFLIKYLKLKSVQDVINIVATFYDAQLIQPKTQFMIEEIVEGLLRT